MKNTILEIIDELCGRYVASPQMSSSYGICGGEAGLACLCSTMYDLTNEAKYKEWSNDAIKYLLVKNAHFTESSLGYGRAAVYWLFSHLEKKGLITGADDLLKENEGILTAECKRLLSIGDLDYFGGALGILFALNENDTLSEELFSLFNSKVCDRYSETNPHRLDYTIPPDESLKMSGFNLGTPHGLTGIVLFLLQIKEKGQFPVDEGIRLILDLLIYIKHDKMDGVLFPMFIKNDISDNIPSHLAWCYGNLTIIYAFKKASILLNDPVYGRYADQIMSDTIDQTRCRFRNLTLCHGINTVALLFNRLYELFGTDRLREKAGSWHAQAESALTLMYDDYLNKGENSDLFGDPSLINGFPGAALSFLFMDKAIDMDWRFLLL